MTGKHWLLSPHRELTDANINDHPKDCWLPEDCDLFAAFRERMPLYAHHVDCDGDDVTPIKTMTLRYNALEATAC